MPVERIKSGIVLGKVERGKDGQFNCLPEGMNMRPHQLSILDEVADFRRGRSPRRRPNESRLEQKLSETFLSTLCRAGARSMLRE